MPTLKSVASVTTGEPDAFFSVIACSSVMASSLWRITSKVIGSMPALAERAFGCGVSMGAPSVKIDGKIAGVVEPRRLAGSDIDGGLRMLDHGRTAHAQSRRDVRPLQHLGLGP